MATAVAVSVISVNVLALMGVVWWGGQFAGRITSTLEIVGRDVSRIERKLDAHIAMHREPDIGTD